MNELGERLTELIECCGYRNRKDFYIDMYQRRGQDNPEKTYEANKANISKCFDGQRQFPIDDLKWIETMLETNLSYLYDGKDYVETHVTFATAVKGDRIEDIIQLAQYFGNDEDYGTIFYNNDEYGCTILDYIYFYSNETKNHNALKYLIKHDLVKFGLRSYPNLLTSRINKTEEKTLENALMDIVFDSDDSDLFYKALEPAKNHYYGQWEYTFYDNEHICKRILNSKSIFNELFNQEFSFPQKRNECELDSTWFHPLMLNLIRYGLENIDEYELQIIKMLDYANKFNDRQFTTISNYTHDCWMNGNIFEIKGMHGGNFFNLDYNKYHITNEKIKRLILEIKENIKIFNDFIDGQIDTYIAKSDVTDNGYILRDKLKNEDEINFLKIMKEKNCSLTPWYMGEEKGKDIIKPLKGDRMKTYRASDKLLYEIAASLGKINKISSKNLEKGKAYCNNNIDYYSIIIRADNTVGIDNWEHCTIGDEWTDLISTFIKLSDVAVNYYSKDTYFDVLLKMVEKFDANQSFKSGFADKMQKTIDLIANGLDRKANNYPVLFKDLYIVKAWVELHREEITKLIG